MKKIIGIGLGLIGGSMLLSLKRFWPEVEFLGQDTNSQHLKKAIDLGIISRQVQQEDFKNADLVIVSIPVDVAPNVIEQLLDQIGPKTLVIDTGSTKAKLCAYLKNHPKRDQFMATHPIAGTEFSGPQAAFAELFDHKTMIVCEVEKTNLKLQQRAIQCFENMQMKLRYMNPVAHNKHMAYVSHLSHISSFMLGKTVIDKEENERNIFDLAGSGFESTVRLAKSNPQTWTPIFKQNKTFVLEALSEYIHNLKNFETALKQDDFEQLYKDMNNTNIVKDILKGIHI
ncbi:prephenate dehydrogenase [Flavobacteriaceae bacterium 14752]|uniref:prephenate dehydrogenase n=1 Tax=Mesohalobacter salilacus TaxID=2491711 RepID=UPI000F63D362|nr:prephenate dehydrogenase [Flavobacteriaceae bacterium 14752]